MKKLTALLALLLCLVFVCIPVMAEGENDAPKELRSFLVSVTTPSHGAIPKPVTARDLKLMGTASSGIALSDGSPLRPEVDYFVQESLWYNTQTGTPINEESLENTFLNGQSYTVLLRFYFANAEWEGAFERFFSTVIEGREVKPTRSQTPEGAPLTVEGRQVYEVSRAFICDSGVKAPELTLSVEGEPRKEYDGKNVLLAVSHEKAEGAVYRYEWYRNETLLPEANGEILTVFSVKDSGKYACKVYAAPADTPDDSTVFAWTEETQVEIAPHGIIVQIGDEEKNVFDPDPAFSYTIMGEVYDALEGTPARVPGEDIGEYQITQGTLAFPEAVADNYLVQYIPGTLKILDAGELPFTSVIPADFSFITGESGSKIRVQAAKGCIPEGATLALHLPDEKAVEELEALTGKTVLKGFLVSIMADGKEVSLPKYGSLKIQIPLTSEEAELLLSEPLAGFYNGKAAVLDAGRIENGSVAYLSVQIDSLGTVVIFKGEARAVGEVTPEEEEPDSDGEPEKQNSAFLWILGGFLILLAVGGIVFTVIWTQKNGAPKPAVQKAAAPAPEKKPAKAAPPVPEDADVKVAPPPQKKKNVISFDDLED